MAVDWDSPKRERKEYLYYATEWEAKDWLGNNQSHYPTEENHAQNERGDDGTIGDDTLQELRESEPPERPPGYQS